jgi:hypothetical protein
MKKLSILALAALFLVGFSACEKTEGSGNDTAAAGTDAANSTAPATNPTGEVTNPTNEPELPVTSVEYFEDSHNFGEIKEGEKVSHVYKFKNTGNQPYVISSVKPSCGCTTPEYSQGEIAPGQEGFVKVEFDSKGKTGAQKKQVTVVGNTEPKTKILSFTGEVVGA